MAQKRPAPTDPVRLKAQQMREEQARKDRRTRTIIFGIVGALVVAIIAAVTLVIVNQNNSGAGESGSQSGDAQGVLGSLADGSPVVYSHLGVGQADESLPTLTEYFDYSCHWCATYDVAFGRDLSQNAADGDFNIEFQPVTTADFPFARPATTASLIVAQQDPEHWLDFHHALLAYFNETSEAGDNRVTTDLDASFEQVQEIAADAGVPSAVIATFQENAVDSYLEASSAAWAQAPITGRDSSGIGTPEFVRDGTTRIVPPSSSAESYFDAIVSAMSAPAQSGD